MHTIISSPIVINKSNQSNLKPKLTQKAVFCAVFLNFLLLAASHVIIDMMFSRLYNEISHYVTV